MVNDAMKSEFIERARRSVDSHLAFANFVKFAEPYCGEDSPLVEETKTPKFDAIWFEMEIVNGAALSDWEDAGKPVDWTSSWDTFFKRDAIELVDSLTSLLSQK